MDVDLIVSPYHLGRPRIVVGCGPERLLAAGAAATLADLGHRVRVTTIALNETGLNEIAASFAVCRLVAAEVAASVARGGFPLVLAGNCNSAALGTIGGLAPAELGIVWFDAHADFTTADTTSSGFFAGMALAIATGSGWRRLRETIPGFRPVPEERVVLVGARSFEDGESQRLRASPVAVVPPADVGGGGLEAALAALRSRVDGVYLHFDLDVLDPADGVASGWAAPGGPSLTDLAAAVRLVGERFAIRGAGVTAYDPAADADGRAARAGLLLLAEIAQAAGRSV